MRCGFLSGNLPKLRHPNEPIQPKRLYGIRGRSAEAHFRGGDCSDERCRTQVVALRRVIWFVGITFLRWWQGLPCMLPTEGNGSPLKG